MPLKLVPPRPGRSPNYRIRGTVRGVPVDETTGTSDPDVADAIRIKRESEILNRSVFGQGASRSFAEAAVLYVETVKPKGTQRDAVVGKVRKDKSVGPNLVDDLGPKLLSSIGQIAVNSIIAKRFSDASPGTIQRNLITPLTAVMRFAARQGWCSPPVFERPKQPKGRTRWATVDEAEALIAVASPHLRVLIIFLIYTGARMAEALELEWRDVNLAQRWLVFQKTKRNEEPRGVALHRIAVAELANLPYREGKVFRTQRGKPYADRKRQAGGQVKVGWAITCVRAGLARWLGKAKQGRKLEWIAEPISPHSLRHTFSTWLTMAGVHEQVRDELMGHASSSMGRRYSHVPRPDLLKAVDLLPDIDVGGIDVEHSVRRIAKRKTNQKGSK